MAGPEKDRELLKRIRDCIENGSYKFTNHALERRKERVFELPDILYVLRHGFHENEKDSWDTQHGAWNYAIRGKTLERKDARVIVSFDPSKRMLIITVIRINKRLSL